MMTRMMRVGEQGAQSPCVGRIIVEAVVPELFTPVGHGLTIKMAMPNLAGHRGGKDDAVIRILRNRRHQVIRIFGFDMLRGLDGGNEREGLVKVIRFAQVDLEEFRMIRSW